MSATCDEETEQRRAREVERLREMWEEGLASGPGKELTEELVEEIIARGRARRGA